MVVEGVVSEDKLVSLGSVLEGRGWYVGCGR